MYKAHWNSYHLTFIKAATTSRGSMQTKETFFIHLENKEGLKGIGECNLFRGLSCDDIPDFESKLSQVVEEVNRGVYIPELLDRLRDYPAIAMGLESAWMQMQHQGLLFPSEFTEGKASIAINGLVWMAPIDDMLMQVEQKIQAGFRVIKIKIGALNWAEELDLLSHIRSHYKALDLELRVDANGAFEEVDCMKKIDQLAALDIHSIEQPIAPNKHGLMAELCRLSPVPIALDEELIGVNECDAKGALLEVLRPQYIILKPALLGGFKASQEWITEAENRGIAWWVTSALESNVGLEAIAQWTYTLQSPLPQGLGTGQLYANNLASPLELNGAMLSYNTQKL